MGSVQHPLRNRTGRRLWHGKIPIGNIGSNQERPMSTATITRPAIETLRDLVDRLGDIPLERIRFHPAPGTATEADVLARPDGVKRLCELVDGVLVEKAPDFYGSALSAVFIG